MGFIKRLFSKTGSQDDPAAVMKIAKDIGPLIDETTNKIFLLYSTELLKEPITYIVPAVWGAKKEGELTAVQKEIHEKVAPVIEKIIHTFEFQTLSVSQEYALRYLVCGMFITKVTFMIEAAHNKGIGKPSSSQNDLDILHSLEPMGKA